MSRQSRGYVDVAVIGGGLAGSAAAYRLAKGGASVLLFEKETKPRHKVCGEFLSGEALPLLNRIGIEPARLGAAIIERFRAHAPNGSCELRLPLSAVGVSRLALDQALHERAREAGAEIMSGVQVKDVELPLSGGFGDLIQVRTTSGTYQARRLVLATGKHEFKPLQSRNGRDSSLVGMKMHLRLKPSVAARMRDACELFVFAGGYGGIAPIEGGLFNFCFVLDKDLVKRIGLDWDSVAAELSAMNRALSVALDGSVPQLPRLLSVAPIPYGFVRKTPSPAGVLMVGDQAAVIPSLTGDGMTIALMTGWRAAEALLAEGEIREAGQDAIEEHEIQGRDPLRSAELAAKSYDALVGPLLRRQMGAAVPLHALFRSPKLCDLAVMMARARPSWVESVFHATRWQEAVTAIGGGRRG